MPHFAIALPLIAALTPLSLDNDFVSSLGAAGLSPETAKFDQGIMRFFRESKFETPLFESFHEDPWRIPFYIDMWKRQLKVSVGDPSETVSVAARMLGQGTRRSLLGNPIQSAIDVGIKVGAFKATLESMKKKGLISGEIPNFSAVPGPVQEAAAVLLQVAMQTISYRRSAFALVPGYGEMFSRALSDTIESADPEQNQRDLQFYERADLKYLFAAGADLCGAAKHSQVVSQVVEPNAKYKWQCKTEWGDIILSGGTDDTYAPSATLLIIDTGGNDVYVNGASNKSATNWLSVIVDTAGNDKYVSDLRLTNQSIDKFDDRKKTGAWGPGSAIFGISAIIDSSGDDLYRSHRPGLGSALFGVAYIEDSTGNDTYDAYAYGIGAGQFGIGVVEDWKGNDRYNAFTTSQGFGGVLGFGGLIDRSGVDSYVANDTVIDFPSPQSKDHNVSLCQGAASGRRADYIDGHSLSGGVGILFDETGNDHYSCAVFGSGTGYWEGVGMLWEDAGDDIYDGAWYVQGASAHYGIGYLGDEIGNDQYTATMNMAQGAGHDFGVGMLVDDGGTDKYKAPNLSLGAGNANGIGVFVDGFGDDTYDSVGITLGRSAEAQKGSIRERALSLGIFMDLSGNDTYPQSATWAGNGRRQANWTDKRPRPEESQVGIFLDR